MSNQGQVLVQFENALMLRGTQAVFRRLSRRVNRPALLALGQPSTLTISALPACFELRAFLSWLKPQI